ncbi:hypothetical protein KEM56_004152 [Ascosphaera pollenicola]|nr:hypothetical protein KEM56_004152 [Ascosphaera pollenicola]
MASEVKTPSDAITPGNEHKLGQFHDVPFDDSYPYDPKEEGIVEPEIRQKWYQWFSPADTPEERRLLYKLDGLIMVFVFLAYWAKTLDSSSAQTAYVSGMKEALNMNGNELNYLNTVYQVGFIVLEIPMVMLLTRFQARYFLPLTDLLWAAFTLGQYAVTSVKQMYALRFFVGTLGGFFFPAVQWYLGSWYKRSEMARRGAIFFIASQVGQMSSGYIQTGALAADNRQERQPMTFAKLKHIFSKSWHFWLLVTIAIFFSQADGISGSSSALSLWLKSTGHSVSSINTITTISPAVTIVWSLVNGILSDAFDIKPLLIAITALLNIFAGICLAIWNIPVGLKYFSYFLAGTADGIAAVLYSWANEICSRDAEERALTISAMNTVGNAFGAWIPLFVWKTTDAPRYYIGYNWAIALDVAMVLVLVPLTLLWRKEKKQLRLG